MRAPCTIVGAVRWCLLGGVGPWVRMLHFDRFVRRYIRPLAAPRILDAGCGAGDHLAWVAQRVPRGELVGIDLSRGSTYATNAAHVKQRLQGYRAEFRVGDLRALHYVDRFDVAYTIDVLEHIPGNELVLRNLHQALVPGGVLYLAMPYDRPRPTVLPFPVPARFRDWADEEHVGEMRTLQETRSLLEAIGFQILEARYTFGPVARACWEAEQIVRALPGGRILDRLVAPGLNLLAAADLVDSPNDGNLMLIARKPGP